MRKVLLSFIFVLPFLLIACSKQTTLQQSMSEITKIYFSAQGDGVKGNISVGEREENYLIDGYHTENCEFSLIALQFEKLLPQNQIEVNLKINDESSKIVLDINPANNFYMTDLGYSLKESDKIVISFENFVLNFENVSESFGVDYSQALKLGQDALGDKLNSYYQGKDFQGEGYLKILTDKSQTGELFWVLTLVGRNNNKNNVVLSTADGEIIVLE